MVKYNALLSVSLGIAYSNQVALKIKFHDHFIPEYT